MSSRYKVHDSLLPHFITCTVVGWVDVLSRESYKNIICDSLTFCTQEKGLLLHAWVIMSNHIHLVISTNGDNQIGDIVRDFKKFTAKEITTAIENNPGESRKEWMMQLFYNAGDHNSSNKDIQFWQQNYHPIALDTHNKTIQRLEYLHNNPVRSTGASLVALPCAVAKLVSAYIRRFATGIHGSIVSTTTPAI